VPVKNVMNVGLWIADGSAGLFAMNLMPGEGCLSSEKGPGGERSPGPTGPVPWRKPDAYQAVEADSATCANRWHSVQ